MYKELKIIVKAATRRGWKLTHGAKHHVLTHPSGAKTSVSMSPSDRNAHRSLGRAIRRIEQENENANYARTAAGRAEQSAGV